MNLSEEIKISTSKNHDGRWLPYRDLIHSLPLAVYAVDKDGYITMFNDAAAELWGRRPEPGKDRWCGSWKIYELNDEIELPLNKYPLALAFEDKEKNNNKHPLIILRPDGSKRSLISYPNLIFDPNDDIEGAINILVDVTEIDIPGKEKIELADTVQSSDNANIAEMDEINARLAAIIQSSDDVIISKTLEGIITSWNAAAEKLFGYTEEEMIGQPITKIIPPDRLNEEVEILSRLKRGEKIEHFETKRMTREGKQFDISLTISPVRDSKGNIIGASKIGRDITDRKRTDEINARLAAIVQSSDDAIISKTLTGTITSWNQAAEKLFGYTEEEMIGESIMKIIPADRSNEEQEILNTLKEGNRVDHFETKRVCRDGTMLDISLTSSPIKDSTGKIIGASKIARNITTEKKTQRLLDEKEERLIMMVEATSLGTWEYNDSKLFCSTESRKICGLPVDASPDIKTIIQHIYSEDRMYFLQEV
ncbi:MAG TPA: PAS domain S-box protein, partial [Chitinophagaceae bacterium]